MFAELPEDEIDVMFAQRSVALGMASADMRTVIDTKRRLDAWVHSQFAMLTSSWGENASASPSSLAPNKILVLSSERDLFFGKGPSVSALAAFFGVEPLVIEGKHLEVMSNCAMGQHDQFNSALSRLGL